jgi:hypothetical protein
MPLASQSLINLAAAPLTSPQIRRVALYFPLNPNNPSVAIAALRRPAVCFRRRVRRQLRGVRPLLQRPLPVGSWRLAVTALSRSIPPYRRGKRCLARVFQRNRRRYRRRAHWHLLRCLRLELPAAFKVRLRLHPRAAVRQRQERGRSRRNHLGRSLTRRPLRPRPKLQHVPPPPRAPALPPPVAYGSRPLQIRAQLCRL